MNKREIAFIKLVGSIGITLIIVYTILNYFPNLGLVGILLELYVGYKAGGYFNIILRD